MGKVKKLLLIGLAFLCCSAVPTGAPWKLGLRAGANFSYLRFEENDGHWEFARLSTYAGPVLGGIVEVGFSEFLVVRLEPADIQKGTLWSLPYPWAASKQALKLELFSMSCQPRRAVPVEPSPVRRLCRPECRLEHDQGVQHVGDFG